MKAINDTFDLSNPIRVEALHKRIDSVAGMVQKSLQSGRKFSTVYVVTVDKYVHKRSSQQNRYYWECIVQYLASQHGYSEEEMHEYLKLTFNPKVIYDKLTGQKKVLPGSTKDMTTEQFSEYMERIRREYYLEHGIFIAAPGELTDA